jgi:SAM-dependent methyltransferase
MYRVTALFIEGVVIMNVRELQRAVEETIFVGCAHRMGILTELHRNPDTAAGIARRMGLDARVTWALLEALVEMEYCIVSDGKYAITDDTRARLVEVGGPDYEGDFWSFLLYLMNPWRSLPSVLKTGKPDVSSYEGFSMTDFIRGMDSPWKKIIVPEIIDICLQYCPHAQTAADIGGAPGTIAREFARRGVKTIVFDLPEAIAVTRDELSRVPGIELSEGDATRNMPDGPYDIAFLGNLCHGQSPEDNAAIIRRCSDHLAEHGIIVIFDNLRGESYLGATLALHMVTQSPYGNVYSRDEYLKWCADAKFRDVSVIKLSDPAWQLVIGRKELS